MAILTDGDIAAVQRTRDVANSFTMARAIFTPFKTMVRKGPKPRSTLFESPFKQRITPTDSAIADGVDVQDSEIINNEANKCMLQGRLQKGRVAIGISDLADEFGDEFAASNLRADNLRDAVIAAGENLEVTLLKTGDSQAYGGSGTPAKTRGFGSWIRSANAGGTPDLPINALALTPAANILSGVSDVTTLTDLDLNNIMHSISLAARQTGTWDVYCSPDFTKVLDQLTRSGVAVTSGSNQTVPLRRFNNDMADGTIQMMVRTYLTTAGTMRFHLHFSLPTGVHAYIVNHDYVTVRPGYAPRTRDIPYLGGSYKTLVEYVYGQMVDNPRAHGKITT